MRFLCDAQEITQKKYPVWEKLALTTHQADPFCCTPTWQFSFHDAFSPKRRLFIQESSDSALIFAEKVFTDGDIYLTPIEALWFFGCPLLGKHAPEMLLDTMDFFLEAYQPISPKILISGIRPGGVLADRLIKLLGKHFNLRIHSRDFQGVASLAGGLDGYLSRRSANHRHKLKRAIRKAREEGIIFERVVPASPQEVERTYARMLSVELTSWKGIGQCGMAEPCVKDFYGMMIRRLSESKKARVVFAKYENKDMGFIFGGMAGRIYRGQQFSYHHDWKSFSLGNLMQVEQIRWLCEEGAVRYDMGPLNGPRMGYKAHWTEAAIEMQTWVLEKI